MSNLRRLAVAISFLGMGVLPLANGCAAESVDEAESMFGKDGGADAKADAKPAKSAIQLMVTVDWEGRDLSEPNLRAIENLRTRFPSLKLIHFLNAAYFTKLGANPTDTRTRISRALRSGDEHGLHIHGWKRLVEASGVTFRSTPTFWGTDKLTNDCNSDCGHEVPISAYTEAELRKVIAFSSAKLAASGFTRPISFRAGGWMAAPHVRTALVKENFIYDHSAVPSKYLQGEIGTLPVWDWVDDLWKGTSETSQPKALPEDLMEIPDNGALSDYMRADEMVSVYRSLRSQALSGKRPVLSVGFHQETADRFLPILTAALTSIQAEATKDGIAVESVTSTAVPVTF